MQNGQKGVDDSPTTTWRGQTLVWQSEWNMGTTQSMGTNQYPQSLEDTMNLLNMYNKTTRMQSCSKTNMEEYDKQTNIFLHKMQKEGSKIMTIAT